MMRCVLRMRILCWQSCCVRSKSDLLNDKVLFSWQLVQLVAHHRSLIMILRYLSAAILLFLWVCRGAAATHDLFDDRDVKAVEDPEGAYRLGRFYHVESSRQDDSAAFKWMLRAAEMGHASSEFNTGALCFSGRGTATNYAKAMEWFANAAEKGHARAQLNVANNLLEGIRVKTNHNEAAKWYRRAAIQGEARAQQNLSAMLAFGTGVPEDLSEAYKWIFLAAEGGIAEVSEGKKWLESRLSPAAVREARALARSFVPVSEAEPVRAVAILPLRIVSNTSTQGFSVYAADFFIPSSLRPPRTTELISSAGVDYGCRVLGISALDQLSTSNRIALAGLLDASAVYTVEIVRSREHWSGIVRGFDVARGPMTHERTFSATNLLDAQHQVYLAVFNASVPPSAEAARKHICSTDQEIEAVVESRTRFRRSSSYSDLEKSARRVLSGKTNCLHSLIALALARAGQGKMEQADELLAQIIEQSPNCAIAYQIQGTMALHRGDYLTAETLLLKAQLLDPHDVGTLGRLSELFALQRDFDASLFFLGEARALDSFRANIAVKEAAVYAGKGERAQAMVKLREAEHLVNENDSGDQQMLFAAHDLLGNTSEALQHFKRFMALASKEGLATELIAPIQRRAEQIEAGLTPTYILAPKRLERYSREELRRALRERLTGTEVDAVEDPLATTLEMKQWAEEATRAGTNAIERAKLLFQALSACASGGQVSTLSARLAFERKHEVMRCQEQARLFVALARAIGLDAYVVNVERDAFDRQVAHQCAGVIHEGTGLLVDPSYFWCGASHKKFEYLDDLRATASFLSQFPDLQRKQIAAKLDPTDPWVQSSYLFDLMSGNRWEDARLVREKVKSLRPDSWMVVLTDGLFAWRAGDSAEAVRLLNRAGEINPDESEIDLQLAQMFVKMKRFEAARERYLQALMKADGKSEADEALEALAELSVLAAEKGGLQHSQ